MDAIIERCCGLDVHKKTIVACLLIGQGHQRPKKEIRTFQTVTKELAAMKDWLLSQGCTHVGMESTGVYWKPVFNILEGFFEIIVGNARHIKNVPGRKTDVKDSEWIAQLIRHGLIAKSFVPPKPIRELRDLCRYRRKLIESRTSERNRLLKLLETANIKIASVATDVFGASGTNMIKAIIEGSSNPQEMAELAKGRLRSKLEHLELALEGTVEQHHRSLLKLQMNRLRHIEKDIQNLERTLTERLSPYQRQIQLLDEIPGVDTLTASAIIAEIGTDMTVFKTPHHLAAWAGVCPGNNESAGKRSSGRSRKGNIHLQIVLVEAATSAAKKKGTYLKDKFFRLKARRGYKRAAMAIAHKILVSAYHILADDCSYRELGEAYLDQQDKTRVTNNLVRRLERLGYAVSIEQKVA